LVFVGASIGVLAVALAILLIFGARSVSTARPQPPPPRPVGVERAVTSEPLPQAEAELESTSLRDSSYPTKPARRPRNPDYDARRRSFTNPSEVQQGMHDVMQIWLVVLVILGTLFLATLWSIGYGVSLVWLALRRWAERNWP